MKKLLVYTQSSQHQHIKACIEAVTTDYNIVISNQASCLDHLEDVEILVSAALSLEQLRRASSLKWLQSMSSGLNQFPLEDIKAAGILLTSAKGIHAHHMSEYAIGAMLYFARNLHLIFANNKQGNWCNTEPQDQIRGATLGILGYGEIGQQLAKDASYLGMNVVTSSKRQRAEDAYQKPTDMATLFQVSDYIVSILPLTEQTTGLINKHYFDQMKTSAVFINIGRGQNVVEADLIEALNHNKIKGAYLDVFETEPLPSTHPFYSMAHVVITPHLAGLSVHYTDKIMDKFTTNLKAYLNKTPLEGLIDYQLGY